MAYVYIEYPKMIRIEGVDFIVYNREEEDKLLGVKKTPQKKIKKISLDFNDKDDMTLKKD